MEVRDDPEEALIMIGDTGIGIPADHAERNYDEYFQVPNKYRKNLPGTGLGLGLGLAPAPAPAKEYATLHNGTIGARSEENMGTTFINRLLRWLSHFNHSQIVGQKPTG